MNQSLIETIHQLKTIPQDEITWKGTPWLKEALRQHTVYTDPVYHNTGRIKQITIKTTLRKA